MSSIFKDTDFEPNSGLNIFFKEIAFGFINVTTIGTAKDIGALAGTANKLFIQNGTNQKVYIVVVHPMLTSDVAANRQVLCSVDAGSQFTVESQSPPHIAIPAKTKLMVYAASAPSSGELKVWAFPG